MTATHARFESVVVVVVVVLLGSLVACFGTGCAGKRPPLTQEQLISLREESDAQLAESTHEALVKVLNREKAEYDAFKAGKRTDAPVIDILIISGGGDWGAFGAGYLKGWDSISSGEMVKPQFDVVTGVSTGALIAPFAFLGDPASTETVVNLYRNPRKDWVKQRWPLYFLPNNISFAEVPGLERELEKVATMELIARIAEEGSNGRMLAVNTTNVDDGTMHVWNLVTEAQTAVDSGDPKRVHDIMLASAGIPGAFPFRIIDDEMYVDGGVTANIIYGGRVKEEDSLPARWQAAYPKETIPKTRFWVIFNNQTRPLPQVTAPSWPAVVTRSLEMSTRAATLTSMRHLYAQAEISKLKRNADVEIRFVHVPNDWVPPVPGVFIKETMNNLADMGERMGADPTSWKTDSP